MNKTHQAMAALSSLFDPLCCHEEPLIATTTTIEEDEDRELDTEPISESSELLSSLVSNELQTHHFTSVSDPTNDPYLHSARREAVDWIKAAGSRFGFNALTVILAVNYLDRCFLCSSGLSLQSDKPWMKQLSAVACLSIAAKVEETHVPFLLHLQLSNDEGVGFVFESKTVRRMELLVLSTLDWRMNPVTALSFVQCIVPTLLMKKGETLRSCDSVLLSVLSDWRWVQFPPSVWASAAMLHSMGHQLDVMQQLVELLHVSKERVEDCYGVIVELLGAESKRKSCYFLDEPPTSPDGVMMSSSCFSYESSSSLDSWQTMWPSPSPPFKRPKCSSPSSII